MPDIIRDRAVRLFQFLRELTRLRFKTVRTVDQYEDVLWLADIPNEPECFSAAWPAEEGTEPHEAYVEVSKPEMPRRPVPPKELVPWIDPKQIEDSSKVTPELRETIIVEGHTEVEYRAGPDTDPQFKRLGDNPEIKEVWEQYVEKAWRPWAEENRRLRAVQEVYTRLFSMYQKQQRLGETFEVVLGIGCLSWRTPDGQDIRRHLIAAQLELSFDAEKGIITVGPANEGAQARLEQDMIDARPDPALEESIEQRISDAGNNLLGNDEIVRCLREWVNAIDTRATGRFDNSLRPAEGFPSGPTVHFAPAVILRKRTGRNLMRAFSDIADRMASTGDADVPKGIRGVVSVEDKLPDEEPVPDDSLKPPGTLEPLLFPLPANEEQKEIAWRLSSKSGVLVQGPPGTGKSHTIANLVSHLLASGQRVLVTSHGARALKVLKDKLPGSIAELCVFLLGNDLAARESLEKSVRSITGHRDGWNPKENKRRIERIEHKLHEACKSEANTLRRLREIREQDTYRHEKLFGNYSGTAQDIAIRVARENKRYGWIADFVENQQEPALTNSEATELLELLRSIDEVQEEVLSQTIVNPDSLLSPSEFATQVEIEQEARKRYEAVEDYTNHTAYPALASAPREKRVALTKELDKLVAEYEALLDHSQSWVGKATRQVLSGHTETWHELLVITREQLRAIGSHATTASETEVSGLEKRNFSAVRADAESLLHHLEKGRKLGFWIFRPKVVKKALYLIKGIRVNGKPCNNAGILGKLLEWFDVSARLKVLRNHWPEEVVLPTGSFRVQVAGYSELSSLLERVVGIQNKVEAVKSAMSELPGLSEPAWDRLDDLCSLQKTLEAADLHRRLEQAQKELKKLEFTLRRAAEAPSSSPVIAFVLEAVITRNRKDYNESSQSLQKLHSQQQALQRRQKYLSQLGAQAPNLAYDLESNYKDQAWDERFRNFEEAWNWARANHWLQQYSDTKEYTRLLDALDRQRSNVLHLLGELAVAKAWRACLARLKEPERKHLMAWANAVRQIPKRTGKYAELHRRNARAHMDKCRSAIPAWVMPIYRVAESVKPEPNAFDIVIIDEASQSGPEALFLQYIAKKIIVVGDEEQISPDDIGISPGIVEQLRQRYLYDIPMRDAIGVGTSFFGLAKILFGNVIRLREHFRCMPEIIRFSNDLCYSTKPLIPLRQHGAKRLEPPVIAHHVPDGYQEGERSRTVNRPEAEALVAQIEKCIADEKYTGKSMGVIGLLGYDQAKLINKMLLDRIGPEEMESRQIVCGNAYAFQGDERDVMFLSMVSAPSGGPRIGTLTHDRYKRIFNVAASRAKDQMWLFYTATLNDLSRKCFRHRLLKYCLHPEAQHIIQGVPSDEYLRRLELQTDSPTRARDGRPPHPFESWFEVDVYLQIARREFRVIPQFEVAGKRIDLVVEGLNDRLAVECDGDETHGLEHFEEDMARQRMLERCGWTFWRVRGSDFYRNREEALKSLWSLLASRGIRPAREESVEPEHAQKPIAEAPTQAPPTSAAEEVPSSSAEEAAATPDIAARPEPALPPAAPETRPAGPREQKEPLGAGTTQRYKPWQQHRLPDPRSASTQAVYDGLMEIIAAEGPVLKERVFHLYVRAAGIGRVARIIRRALETGLGRAMRFKEIEVHKENLSPSETEEVLVTASSVRTVVRTLGTRTLHEVPLSELAEVIQRFESRGYREEDALFREVLRNYSSVRLTAEVRARLRAARHLGRPDYDQPPDEDHEFLQPKLDL